MKHFLINRWFLIVMGIMLTAGFVWPMELAPVADNTPRSAVVFAVLLLMSLPLEAQAMGRALRKPGPTLLAVAVNLALVPLLALALRGTLITPFSVGLFVIAVIPCTQASAAVWTRRAGGNDAVAMLVMMITNMLCFVVTPLWLQFITEKQTTTDASFGDLFWRLMGIVVLPILVGQLMRYFSPAIARWGTSNKTSLSIGAQIGILWMVLIGAIDAGQKLATASEGGSASSVDLVDWGVMIVVAVAIHCIALAAGWWLARLFKMPLENRIAVGIAGSQKTLLVGLDIGMQYFGGLSVAPMITYHVGQLIIDTLVVDWLRAKQEASAKATPSAPHPPGPADASDDLSIVPD